MADTLDRLQTALHDRYAIEREIGAGGMAMVYLAEDRKHRRRVALKVLRPELAATLGPERFLQEIEIAAQLQHPNILALYDSGEADGFLFYVMPYIEGPSLRDKLAKEGELPIGDAVRILRDVVDALTEAHAHDVVHRDIKPENVLLRGRHALVTDFGVAKAVSEATGRQHLTTAGTALGTPAYMAPEQAAADPQIDRRADIYAVGVVAYELLTGRTPITGTSAQELLAAQVTQIPEPVSRYRDKVPAGLELLVMKCLEKKPADRWQSTEELLPQLEALTTPTLGTTPVTTMGVSRTPRRWQPWAAAGALAAVVASVALLATRDGGNGGSLPPPERMQLTYERWAFMPELSADGQYVAWWGEGGIRVQDVAGGRSVLVADSIDGFLEMRWSPDGTRLGFSGQYRGREGIFLFPRLGGTPERVPVRGVFTWSPDGTRIATWSIHPGALVIADLETGASDTLELAGAGQSVLGMDWSPSGRFLALAEEAAEGRWNLRVLDIESGSQVPALTDTVGLRRPRWAPGGEAIYYSQGFALNRLAVDARTGRPRGEPQRVVTLESGAYAISLSADGTRLVYGKRFVYSNYSVAREGLGGQGAETVALTQGTARKTCPELSPDGRVLAFLQESNDGWDLHQVATSGGEPERLTFDGAATSDCPAWGPSGDRLAFVTRLAGTRLVAVIAASGGTPQVFEHAKVSYGLAWAPGSWIAYRTLDELGYVLLDPETGDERPLVQDESFGWVDDPAFSPDGSMAAVAWSRDTRGLGVLSLEDGSFRQIAILDGYWDILGWSLDGRMLYARHRDTGEIRRFPSAGGESVPVAQPELDGVGCEPHERPGGLMWVCEGGEAYYAVWTIDNFRPEYERR